ncbi:nuclear transport factor 2 family protein [Ferrimonas balearica]|uniref:nuclear transport factor 2 family protein n=1 Tax=Ferrimonas balearica TaxID=44012 RepID=UPI001C99B1F6|nr:nuclear transport factor 2 family protein [Ferrimonas balearica]MBY5920822.1 nuclear transport factor 2 family protein [Ferrimonas balearica]MBY5996493.1 nuclear transport factor 2 family protein [Ferrimonas balearica]
MLHKIPEGPMEAFARTWQTLSREHLDRVDTLYHPDMTFIDPSGEIHGRERFKSHLATLYHNVNACHFELGMPIGAPPHWAQPWVMTLYHPKLAGGKPVRVEGISELNTRDGLIIRHRDYFDLGQMLYEQVPLFGAATRWLKGKVSP